MVYAVIQRQRLEMLKTVCRWDVIVFTFFVVVVEGNNAGRLEVFKNKINFKLLQSKRT